MVEYCDIYIGTLIACAPFSCHVGRSVYRQASVSESDRRTCDRPGPHGRYGPDERAHESTCYRLNMDVPSWIDMGKSENEE